MPVFAIGLFDFFLATYLRIHEDFPYQIDGTVKRYEAFAEFNAAYCKARDSLVQLKNMVHERCGRDA
jgi:hypothetical protein